MMSKSCGASQICLVNSGTAYLATRRRRWVLRAFAILVLKFLVHGSIRVFRTMSQLLETLIQHWYASWLKTLRTMCSVELLLPCWRNLFLETNCAACACSDGLFQLVCHRNCVLKGRECFRKSPVCRVTHGTFLYVRADCSLIEAI